MSSEIADRHVWMLKDRDSGQLRLGCHDCLDRVLCGGLHSAATASGDLSCLSECRCVNSESCDQVCPNAPERFAARVREVHGFDFHNIPRAPDLTLPAIPDALPIFDGSHKGDVLTSLDFAALPFTRALRRHEGRDYAKTASELSASVGVKPRRGWILTGVQPDRHVERTWRLNGLANVLGQLRGAGVVMATTPNFSLYIDSPRHDNLHAMKRIAWMWFLLQQAGIPTALHINGRTDHDFQRWAQFAQNHPELKAVAFEFHTGSGGVDDIPIYLERLKRFAGQVGRPLWMLLRGRNELRFELASHFERVIVLDANACHKTIHRRAGHLLADGRVRFSQALTQTPQQVAALLRHNLAVWRASLAPRAIGVPTQLIMDFESDGKAQQSRAKRYVEPNGESLQLKLFA